jgi:hypothetical protein
MKQPDFIKQIYTFKDIPKKKKFLIERLKEIYPTTNEKDIEEVLNSIKIRFREQEERGASNHKKRTIYLPLYDVKKCFLKTKEDLIRYMENPKSVITHETTHIFQNLAEAFPHVQYLEKQDSGKYEIDYDKYFNDSGEKEARLEQVLELLGWGFSKPEIIFFLYNRIHDDRPLWERIINRALELKNNKT